MTARIARLCTQAPRPLLGFCVLATLALGLYGLGVPDRLSLGGGSLTDSQSELAAAELGAELGFDPEPAFILVVSGAEPLSSAANDVALDTLVEQVKSIRGVEAALEGPVSDDGLTTTVAVHLPTDAGAELSDSVAEGLQGRLDPGPLQVLLGGMQATGTGARDTALDDAPMLTLGALPLLLLVLAGSLGFRLGLATLLAAGLATALSVSALGLLGEFAELQAIAVVAAAFVAVVSAVEVAAVLAYRYREESATLGAGPEALEYSLHTVLKGTAIGIVSAVLIGVALLFVPVDFVHSIGVAVALAAVLAPAAALLPIGAALSLRAEQEVGEALPLVPADSRPEGGPRSFRAILAFARRRGRAAIVVVPLAAVVLVALSLTDSEAVGLSAGELPAEQQAAIADAEIAGAFGPGSSGPLIVITDGEPEAPTLTLYRDSISRLDHIGLVDLARPAGPFAYFGAAPTARPQSLAAQDAIAAIADVPAPTARRITGPAAELRDTAVGLGNDLPLVAIVALLGTAALWSLLFRSAFGPLLALSSAVGPLVGLAAVVYIFSDGRLAETLDYAPAGAPHLQTYVLTGAVLLALGLARGAQTATALREELTLGGSAAGSLARSSVLTLWPAATATLIGVIVAGVWIGSPLLPAKELAVGLSIGLLADLLLTRCLIAPGLARLSMRSER